MSVVMCVHRLVTVYMARTLRTLCVYLVIALCVACAAGQVAVDPLG